MKKNYIIYKILIINYINYKKLNILYVYTCICMYVYIGSSRSCIKFVEKKKEKVNRMYQLQISSSKIQYISTSLYIYKKKLNFFTRSYEMITHKCDIVLSHKVCYVLRHIILNIEIPY